MERIDGFPVVPLSRLKHSVFSFEKKSIGIISPVLWTNDEVVVIFYSSLLNVSDCR